MSAPSAAFPTASWGRRLLALAVDLVASGLVVNMVVDPETLQDSPMRLWFPPLVFVVEAALFTWLLGGSFGKLVTGLRVVPAEGRWRPINPLVLLLRQLMVALVIPPLVFRPDGRGTHDLVAGTATVTKDTFRSLMPT